MVINALGSLLVDNSKLMEMVTRDLACVPPPGDVAGYSDGSALGNPGPCCGGFAVLVGGALIEEQWMQLGHGDNNKGEMAALRGLAQWLLAYFQSGKWPAGADALIFSDSAGCVGYLQRGWKTPQTRCSHGQPGRP